MTERQRRYREECLIDLLMEAEEIEEEFLPREFDRLLPVAMEMLEAEEKGVLMHYTMLVVLKEVKPTAMDTGRWIYEVFQEKDAADLVGCSHTVDAGSLQQARMDARNLHKRNCVGKGL